MQSNIENIHRLTEHLQNLGIVNTCFYQALESPETKHNHQFTIALKNISEQEKQQFLQQEIYWEMHAKNDSPLLVIILNIGNEPEITVEAPFNILKIPSKQLELPDVITPEYQIKLEVHLVEQSNHTLIATRKLIVPTEASLAFFEKVHEQFRYRPNEFNHDYQEYLHQAAQTALSKPVSYQLQNAK